MVLWWSVSFSLNNIADFLTFANTWEHSWISSAATSTTLHTTSPSLHYINEATTNIGTSLIPSKGLCCYCLFHVLQNAIKLPNINFRNSMRTCKGPFRTNHFQNYHQNIHAQPIWIQKFPGHHICSDLRSIQPFTMKLFVDGGQLVTVVMRRWCSLVSIGVTRCNTCNYCCVWH